MLDDLRALVEFAQAGSIAGAADRLFRTPSAITRQVQRLEAALGAELLDRSVKPPRLNSLGSRVLEQARDLLQRTEALKSLASPDAEPHGLLRIGLSHAQLQAQQPDLVTTSITPFGLTGPYRDLAASDLVVMALGGMLNLVGSPEREPLLLGGYQVQYATGICAFTVSEKMM